MSGIESVKDDGGLLQQGLAQVAIRLEEIDRQQERLLQWALKDFQEEAVVRENQKLNQDRLDLYQRRTELENRIKQVLEAQIKLADIRQALDTVNANLGKLSFEERRLALSAIGVRVLVDKDSISIEGSIPLGAVASTPSRRNGERMPSICARQPTQSGQSIPLGWGCSHLGQSGGIIRGSD